jgi:pimeloyl-ACP methyl ester carboxylesterase
MTTYVLIHGAGDVGWSWHLVERELRAKGHDVVAPDLPVDDERATFSDYADTVVQAVGDRAGDDLVVAGISFGGYTAPIVADRLDAKHLVLVAPMVPQPGESPHAMFEATGYAQETQEDTSERAVFLHDVPEDLAAEALSRGRPQAEAIWSEPWPLASWPDVPVTVVLGRNDRLFPVAWLRQVVQDRLGMTPIELESSHTVSLARPVELADILVGVLAPEPATGTGVSDKSIVSDGSSRGTAGRTSCTTSGRVE